MADYRTPFPALLATLLEEAINRLLALDPRSPQRLTQLDNRLLQLQLEDLGITLWFNFSARGVRVSLDGGREPDTAVSGSLVALLSLAVPDGEGAWGAPGSRVRISGDATLARDLERLFSRIEPDWEGELSQWFGDVLGHQVAAGARGAVRQLKQAATAAEDMAGEYFSRPGSPLARPQELRAFSASVDGLRDAVDRLEARIRILREQAAAGGPERRG